jgi:hypothetical protein
MRDHQLNYQLGSIHTLLECTVGAFQALLLLISDNHANQVSLVLHTDLISIVNRILHYTFYYTYDDVTEVRAELAPRQALNRAICQLLYCVIESTNDSGVINFIVTGLNWTLGELTPHPFRYWLFAPESQWQSRGKCRILQGCLGQCRGTSRRCGS